MSNRMNGKDSALIQFGPDLKVTVTVEGKWELEAGSERDDLYRLVDLVKELRDKYKSEKGNPNDKA